MIEEPEVIAKADPAIQEARRVAFMICTVEQQMGIDNGDLPLKARLENILQGAMMNPAAIGPGVFGLLFRLSQATG